MRNEISAECFPFTNPCLFSDGCVHRGAGLQGLTGASGRPLELSPTVKSITAPWKGFEISTRVDLDSAVNHPRQELSVPNQIGFSSPHWPCWCCWSVKLRSFLIQIALFSYDGFSELRLVVGETLRVWFIVKILLPNWLSVDGCLENLALDQLAVELQMRLEGKPWSRSFLRSSIYCIELGRL